MDISAVIRLLKKHVRAGKLPIVTALADTTHDPFRVLISTLLSLRTKDEVTEVASARLFTLASTPRDMLALSEAEISRTIYPVGFYRTKARTIHSVCRELIERYRSQVPDSIDELLTMKGVGRKTANLVVALGYGKPGVCVDTHVHRISNRLGYVSTRTPEETEFALREKLPGRYWIDYNTIMVAFGRMTCRPVSPLCSECPVTAHCKKVGVTKSR